MAGLRALSLTLRNQVESGLLQPERRPRSELAEILIEKGVEHESICLEDYEAMGKTIYEVPGRNADESFAEWVARVGDPLREGLRRYLPDALRARRHARHRRLLGAG